jgi:hypothetical protein
VVCGTMKTSAYFADGRRFTPIFEVRMVFNSISLSFWISNSRSNCREASESSSFETENVESNLRPIVCSRTITTNSGKY